MSKKCDSGTILERLGKHSGYVGIFVAPFRIQRFLFSLVFTDQRVRFWVIGTQLLPGHSVTCLAFFNGYNARFTRIGRSGWHSSSFFYV